MLDERIQEAAHSLKYDAIPYFELYITSGIYVPSPDPNIGFNFSAISYPRATDYKKGAKEQVKNLLQNVTNISTETGKKVGFNRIKFLVIHLGVLEKILSAEGPRASKPEEERSAIAGLAKELCSALPNALGEKVKPIIISGRGLPTNLPPDISFVSYSAVSQYLIDNRNKYLLNELLYSTRKIPKQ